MATYIFVPVMTPEMASIANTWNNDRTKVGKGAYPIIAGDDSGLSKALRRKFGTGKLSTVQAGDKLWVLSHGISATDGDGAVVIGNKRGGVLKSAFIGGLTVEGGTYKLYHVDRLARAIDKEGLTKNFVDLRLYCCNAGLGATYKGRQLQPFAERLKQALVGRGYNQVVVKGFRGSLIAGYSEFYAPNTIVVGQEAVTGIGLGIQVPGETYAQDAYLHVQDF